jgi:hypothetical protein
MDPQRVESTRKVTCNDQSGCANTVCIVPMDQCWPLL